MYDAESIEAINCEQLVTATDRWLLRASRGAKRRAVSPSLAAFAPPAAPARFAQGTQVTFAPPAPVQLARGAQVSFAPPAVPAQLARGSQRNLERTVTTRIARGLHLPSIAIGVAIPSLFGLACGLAALL